MWINRTISTRDRIEKSLQLLIDGIALAHQAEGKLNYGRGYPSVINNKGMVDIVRQSTTKLFTEEALYPIEDPAMTAEDFSFYLNEKPGAFLWFGIEKDDRSTYPLHNPNFDFDEDILWRGASLLYQIAYDFLDK